jgi:hypothetical protein
MQHVQANEQARILVIQDEFVKEMRLALEYAGFERDDTSALKQQMITILQTQSIAAAIVDTALEKQAAHSITDVLFDLSIPFVFAGKENETEIGEELAYHAMAPDLANLTILAQSILGRPTYH